MSFLPSVTGNGLVYTTYIFMVIFLGDRLLFQAHPDTLSSRTSGGRNFPHCESQGISKCSVESFSVTACSVISTESSVTLNKQIT